jgi:hypothetical protein
MSRAGRIDRECEVAGGAEVPDPAGAGGEEQSWRWLAAEGAARIDGDLGGVENRPGEVLVVKRVGEGARRRCGGRRGLDGRVLCLALDGEQAGDFHFALVLSGVAGELAGPDAEAGGVSGDEMEGVAGGEAEPEIVVAGEAEVGAVEATDRLVGGAGEEDAFLIEDMAAHQFLVADGALGAVLETPAVLEGGTVEVDEVAFGVAAEGFGGAVKGAGFVEVVAVEPGEDVAGGDIEAPGDGVVEVAVGSLNEAADALGVALEDVQ